MPFDAQNPPPRQGADPVRLGYFGPASESGGRSLARPDDAGFWRIFLGVLLTVAVVAVVPVLLMMICFALVKVFR